MLAKFAELVKIQFNWIKKYESDIILAIGAMLISLLSFAAGYLSAREHFKGPIQMEDTAYEQTK